jgi:two-component system sensor histidine kinase KdpD
MLQEGHRLLQRGMDIVIGYVEPHLRPETTALTEGLERVPVKPVSLGGREFLEMDVDAILKRAPDIVLIDELAHSNVPGSKHEKRYQDVLEILEQGVNVVSTLNVQHLESVAARVTEATQAPVQERLPDDILRRADQVVVVDVTLEELRERLRLGKIYDRAKAEVALQNFFTYENLSFLREVTLREVAGDQVRKIEAQGLLKAKAVDIAEEAVMVAMSSDPTNAEILLRKAARMAAQLSTKCYAVYVQSRRESPTRIDAGLQRKLQNNLKLAHTLGAEVVTVQGDKIAEALITFATLKHVRHAIFGKPRSTPLMELFKGSVILTFLHESVGVDVHIVTTTGEEPDEGAANP